jgi:hypothetical protein
VKAMLGKVGSRKCLAEGCNRPADKKLCKLHFDKAIETNRVPLKDETDFMWNQTNRKQGKDGDDNKFQFDAAKIAMAATQVFMEDDGGDESDDDIAQHLPTGPLTAKRKAAKSAVIGQEQ